MAEEERKASEHQQAQVVTLFSIEAEMRSGENESNHFQNLSEIEDDRNLTRQPSRKKNHNRQRLSQYHRLLAQGPYGLL
jgi:hypothetical protein